VLVTRLPSSILGKGGVPAIPADAWQDTVALLDSDTNSTWKDIYTGRTVRIVNGRLMIADVLPLLPVAVLIYA